MPMSSFMAITDILACMDALDPASILDVGCGWGQYGLLFRLHIDSPGWGDRLNGTFRGPSNLQLDAFESFEPYLTKVRRSLYDSITVGDIRASVDVLPDYDVIFLGGLVEHFENAEGIQLLSDLFRKAKKALIVLTPFGFVEQGEPCENKDERHRSGWLPSDFRQYPYRHVIVIGNTLRDLRSVAVICKPRELQQRIKWLNQPVRSTVQRLSVGLLGPTHGTRLFISLAGLPGAVKGRLRRGTRRIGEAD